MKTLRSFSTIGILAAVAFALAAAGSDARAGYRGFTDDHMSGYIGANRTITIDDGLGGHVQGMMRMLVKIIDYDRQVVIDGPCRSACTLLTSLGARRVCITPRAELWFHQASLLTGKRSKFWSNTMLQLYPPGIRSYVRGHGGLGRGWIVLKGRRLASAFPSRCGREPATRQASTDRRRPNVPLAGPVFSYASQGR